MIRTYREIKNCFIEACPKQWNDLEGRGSTIRYCSECKQSVHYMLVFDDVTVREHIKKKHCIAVNKKDVMVLGRLTTFDVEE